MSRTLLRIVKKVSFLLHELFTAPLLKRYAGALLMYVVTGILVRGPSSRILSYICERVFERRIIPGTK